MTTKEKAPLPDPISPECDQEISARVFQRLLNHLQNRTDVQNIDLMNLSGFCRNCLAKWYREEAHNRGLPIDIASAKRRVYAEDYQGWKEKYQR